MGILSDLIASPADTLISLLYQIPVILIALTLHEVAHGYVALRCGDPTAQMLGRLSLNPLRHLDPIGTLCMFLFGVGYARPVPVNSRNFRHFRRDDILVSVAGIGVNFCLFLLGSFLMVIVQGFLFTPEFYQLNFYTTSPLLVKKITALDLLSVNSPYISTYMANNSLQMLAENGLTQYLRFPWLLYVQRFLLTFSITNLGLAFFNLLPVPPLDGYHLFNDILFRGKLHIPARVMRLITTGMLLLFAFTDVITNLLFTLESAVQSGVMQGLLWIFGRL